MEVGHQDVEIEALAAGTFEKRKAELAGAGATVDDENFTARKANFEACGVASEAQILGSRRRYGASDSPELELNAKWIHG
jgi:hypothetical protein